MATVPGNPRTRTNSAVTKCCGAEGRGRGWNEARVITRGLLRRVLFKGGPLFLRDRQDVPDG